MASITLKKLDSLLAMKTHVDKDGRIYLCIHYPRLGHKDPNQSPHFFVEIDAEEAARRILGLKKGTRITPDHWKSLLGDSAVPKRPSKSKAAKASK